MGAVRLEQQCALIWRVCLGVSGDRQRADREDAAQYACLRLVGAVRAGARPSNAVARQMAYAALRLRGEREVQCGLLRRHVAAGESTLRRVVDGDPERYVLGLPVTAALTDQQRWLLQRRWFEGVGVDEIAQDLGYSRRNVYKLLAAARRALAAAMGAALVRLAVFWRRAAQAAQRVQDGAGVSWRLSELAAMGLAAALPALTAGVTAAPMHGAAAPAAGAAWVTTGGVRPLGAAASAAGATAPGAASGGGGATAEPRPEESGAGVALPLHAEQEQPEDTHFVAMGGPPDGDGSTLVGLGQGAGCGCPVLFETRDGGRHWRASAAPPGADQVALPAGYPSADSRIFLGASAVHGVADYVVSRFGAAGTPLPVPPGQLALSRTFAVDRRVYVATAAALVELDIDAAPPRVVLAYPASRGVALVATAPDGAAADVVVVAPVAAVSDSTAVPAAAAQLLTCSAAVCTGGGELPADTAMLAVGRAGVLAVAGPQWMALVGADGVQRLALPAPTVVVQGLGVSGGALWMVGGGAGAAGLQVATLPGAASWTGRAPTDGGAGRVAAVVMAGSRVLALLDGGGLRCSSDGGQRWQTSCS